MPIALYYVIFALVINLDRWEAFERLGTKSYRSWGGLSSRWWPWRCRQPGEFSPWPMLWPVALLRVSWFLKFPEALVLFFFLKAYFGTWPGEKSNFVWICLLDLLSAAKLLIRRYLTISRFVFGWAMPPKFTLLKLLKQYMVPEEQVRFSPSCNCIFPIEI